MQSLRINQQLNRWIPLPLFASLSLSLSCSLSLCCSTCCDDFPFFLFSKVISVFPLTALWVCHCQYSSLSLSLSLSLSRLIIHLDHFHPSTLPVTYILVTIQRFMERQRRRRERERERERWNAKKEDPSGDVLPSGRRNLLYKPHVRLGSKIKDRRLGVSVSHQLQGQFAFNPCFVVHNPLTNMTPSIKKPGARETPFGLPTWNHLVNN